MNSRPTDGAALWARVFALGALMATMLAAKDQPQISDSGASAPTQISGENLYTNFIAKLDRHEGLLPVFVDTNQGKIFLSLPQPSHGFDKKSVGSTV